MNIPPSSHPQIRIRSSYAGTAPQSGQPSAHVVDLRSSRVDTTPPAAETAQPEAFARRQNPFWRRSFQPPDVWGRSSALLSSVWGGARLTIMVIVRSPGVVYQSARQQLQNRRTKANEYNEHGKVLWQALQEHPFLPSLRKELFMVVTLALVVMVAASVAQSIPDVQSQKQTIMRQALTAVTHVSAATDSFSKGQWPESLDAIVAARKAFEQMSAQLDQPHQWLLRIISVLPINTRYHQARRITAVGEQLSVAAESIVQAAVAAQSDTAPGDKLRSLSANAGLAQQAITQAQEELNAVSLDTGDPSLNTLTNELKTTLSAAGGSIDQIAGLLQVLNTTMGSRELRRYLVIFENSDEIRPAGGFMGSFVLIDVVDGVIVHQEYPKGGSYDLQGSLALSVTPPKPLAVFRGQWQFQDVNWFSDWPTSAQTIQWFYQHAGGPTVDGVIAITSPLLEQILSIMGPIELEGQRLTSDTVIGIVQRNVEKDYDREKNNPKEYIGKLAYSLQQKISSLSKEQMIQLFQLSQTAVQQKLIMAYVNDPVVNSQLRTLGVSGEIRETPGDYLSIVWANIGGEKTDRVMKRSAVLTSTVEADGATLNNLVIKRKHAGTPGQQFYGVTNTAYVRVYVPEGAILVSARGFIAPPRPVRSTDVPTSPLGYVQEYDDRQIAHKGAVVETREFSKTVFGGWVTLAAGGSQTIELEYRLPRPMESGKSHTLLVQKQPGGVAMDVEYALRLPVGTTIVAAAPASTAKASSTSITHPSEPLVIDRLYGTIAQLP